MTYKKICVHFVGIANDQYYNAIKIWGRPDFTHGRATWSAMGEIAGEDTVIFGRGAFQTPGKWKRKTKPLTAHDYPTE